MRKFLESINLFIHQLNTKTEQTVARVLFNNSMTIALAESCTGCLLSSRLTDIAGSSSYIKANYITYSNDSKINILNVKQETLDEFGSVSEECAREMVDGLFEKNENDICIITTGIAGPTSIEGKPIGTLFVAIKNKYTTKIEKFNTNSTQSRKSIKYKFSQLALNMLIQFLKDNYTAINSVSTLG